MTDAKTRYKQTVLLPQTDFPMKADLATREPARRAQWDQMGLYSMIRAARQGAKPWVLHDGPPYANGDAHTGTGMNKILKDTIVKFRTMQGFDAPYVPGWDCHGLPIEHKVLADLGGVKPPSMTVLELRQRCLDYAKGFIDTQRNQFKATGTLARWEKPYLTIDPAYEANVLQVFSDLHKRGYITRAKRPVHWSWAAQSALAEAELEYEDRTDPSVYVRFLVSGATSLVAGEVTPRGLNEGVVSPGQQSLRTTLFDSRPPESRAALLIWTTTPWTLPANVAVAVAPDAEYAVFDHVREVNGKRVVERAVVAHALFDQLKTKLNLLEINVVQLCFGRDLVGIQYEHPMFGDPAHAGDLVGLHHKTLLPVVAADYVTLEDGTGLVHTAPGHGKEDFETGKREKLPVICPIDEAGKFFTGDRLVKELQVSPAFEDTRGWLKMLEGQNVLKANGLIVNKLREEGWLLHTENIKHSYPHCWRTHTPVIFRVTEQWFVQVDHVDADKHMNPQAKPLRQRLLDEIGKCHWFPAWGQTRISNMVENRPDWCISRQRYWGIPIPAFRVKETGEVLLTSETNQRVVELVRKHGSAVWYDDVNWPVEKLLPPEVAARFKGKTLEKMTDIFDVWFEAGSSFQAVMREDAELKDKFPASMYLEGDDQHRGWFQVSLILSVATTGVAPFKDCLTCAFVVDEKGEKGSKSKGNMWAIDQGCKDLGADLIRYYFASLDTSSPVPVTYKLIQGAGEGYRKIRNTFRALVGNLFDFEPAKNALPAEKLEPLERWVLSRADALVANVTAAFDRYEFHVALRELNHFCNVTLSSQYIDVCKDVLYCEASDSVKRRSAQTACWQLASLLVRMLAPICVHTADEMWEFVPRLPGDAGSVHLASWPSVGDGTRHIDLDLDRRFDNVFRVKGEVDRVLDRMRKEKKVGKGYDTAVSLGVKPDLMAELASMGVARLCDYFNVSAVDLTDASHHAALEGFEPAVDVQGMFVKVSTSAQAACVRCYRRTGDVGKVTAHPELCSRCADVVGDRA